MSQFSERLRELRQSKGITQKQLSTILKLSDRNYQRYEYGEREPTASTLLSIANFFNVSIDFIVGRTENSEINK